MKRMWKWKRVLLDVCNDHTIPEASHGVLHQVERVRALTQKNNEPILAQKSGEK
jgi:hypothetical protein